MANYNNYQYNGYQAQANGGYQAGYQQTVQQYQAAPAQQYTPQANGGYQQNAQYQQPAQQNNGPKRYTFMDIVPTVDNQNRQQMFVVLEGRASNIQPASNTTTGHKVINFSIPVENRSRMIGQACGMEPEADNSGTTWVRVSVWDKAADRFENMIAKHPAPVLTVTGYLSIREYQDNRGAMRRSAEIFCRNYNYVRDTSKKNTQQNVAPAQPQHGTPATPAQMQYQPAQQYAAPQRAQTAPASQQYAPQNTGDPFNVQPAPAPAPAAPQPAPAPAPAPQNMTPFASQAAVPTAPAPAAPVQNQAFNYDLDADNPFNSDNMAGMDAGFVAE